MDDPKFGNTLPRSARARNGSSRRTPPSDDISIQDQARLWVERIYNWPRWKQGALIVACWCGVLCVYALGSANLKEMRPIKKSFT